MTKRITYQCIKCKETTVYEIKDNDSYPIKEGCDCGWIYLDEVN